MRRFPFVAMLSVVIAGAAVPSGVRAAASGQAVVRATYETYLKSFFSKKSIGAYKPYFDSGLYALAAYWAQLPNLPGKRGYACTFDSDPLANAQNGRAVEPITVGTPTAGRGGSSYPVTLTLQFTKGTLPSHVLVTVVKENGRERVSDIIPIIDGKSYPGDSLRATLTKIRNDASCH